MATFTNSDRPTINSRTLYTYKYCLKLNTGTNSLICNKRYFRVRSLLFCHAAICSLHEYYSLFLSKQCTSTKWLLRGQKISYHFLNEIAIYHLVNEKRKLSRKRQKPGNQNFDKLTKTELAWVIVVERIGPVGFLHVFVIGVWCAGSCVGALGSGGKASAYVGWYPSRSGPSSSSWAAKPPFFRSWRGIYPPSL